MPEAVARSLQNGAGFESLLVMALPLVVGGRFELVFAFRRGRKAGSKSLRGPRKPGCDSGESKRRRLHYVDRNTTRWNQWAGGEAEALAGVEAMFSGGYNFFWWRVWLIW